MSQSSSVSTVAGSTATVPALEVQDLLVTFLRTRGLLGILPLIPPILWLMNLFRRVRCALLRRRGLTRLVLRGTGVRWCLARIRLSNLLRSQTVCNRLSFKVGVGEMHGIFGVNGAGKSSLLRAITGLESCKSGRVLVHGVDLSRASAKKIALVITRANREFVTDFTVLENIELIARLYGLNPVVACEVATKLLLRLGVTEADIKKFPGQLSLGGQGKVALVRALIPILGERDETAPDPILLLDEPTIGFDPMAVEQFFAALRVLQASFPRLTIVLATNDPREMGICHDYTAIISGKEAHDDVKFTELKAAVKVFGEAIRAAASIIGSPVEANGAEQLNTESVGVIPKFKKAPAEALSWRHRKDLTRNKFAVVMVATSLIVPNLAALFASSRDPWHGYVMGVVAIFATLLIREAYRILARERDYYGMLETVIASPVSQLQHFLVTSRCSILMQLTQTVVFAGLLAALIYPRIAPGLLNGGDLIFEQAIPLLLVLLGLVVAAYAIGIATALVPFVTSGQMLAFFFISLVPLLAVLCGGVYYEVSQLPPGLRHLAHLNPLTYAANAVSDFLNLKQTTPLALAEMVSQLFPGMRMGWVNIIVMFLLAIPAFCLSVFFYWYLEPILRRAGRMRNARG